MSDNLDEPQSFRAVCLEGSRAPDPLQRQRRNGIGGHEAGAEGFAQARQKPAASRNSAARVSRLCGNQSRSVMSDGYLIPMQTHRVTTAVSNSRFITTIGHVSTVDEAKAFLAAVRAEMSDANH